MNITFNATPEEIQNARTLRDLLEQVLAVETKPDTTALIRTMLDDIDRFLADPDKQPEKNTGAEKDETTADVFSPMESLFSFWHFLIGPSNREVALGKQRAELIERAEHAENSAFEALAELADLKEEHAAALRKLKKLEEEVEDRGETPQP